MNIRVPDDVRDCYPSFYCSRCGDQVPVGMRHFCPRSSRDYQTIVAREAAKSRQATPASTGKESDES